MGILLNKSKNYVINGALDFWQRGTSFAAIANNIYTADRFRYSKSGTMVHTLSKDTDFPTFAQSDVIFPASLRLALTTPQASIGAAEYCFVRQAIEGQVFAPLSGKTITLSFWVQANLAGQYAVSFRNENQDRSIVKSFTVSAASTWEKKTITITHDRTGTWNYGTGIGLEIIWAVAAGSSLLTASDGVWQSGFFAGKTGQVNGVQSGATNFRIAGIQLEEGSSASNFERAGESILNELSLCQRYYEKKYDINDAPGTATTNGMLSALNQTAGSISPSYSVFFKQTKRIIPVVTHYNYATGAVGTFRDTSGPDRTVNANHIGTTGYNCQVLTVAAAQAAYGFFTADAEL